MEDFVGAGWRFPLGVDPRGGIALVRGDVELVQAMRLILSTYPGERPMRPDFGSRLRDFVFRGVNDETRAELAQEVRGALRRWEPRVDINTVQVTRDPDDGALLYIDIGYTPKAVNDQRNLVFPFYTIADEGGEW
jgi:phage baseplate assembly protein W